MFGNSVHLAKSDILSAFRIIPVHPDNYELLGFQWNDKYCVDRYIPMGCRTSCKIFEELSTAIEWIAVNKLGIQAMVHVLDDFLLIEQSKSLAVAKLAQFIDLCQQIGVPLSAEKTVFPTPIIEFLGITLDTRKFEASLPPEKIEKCRSYLHRILKDMQSLVGTLNLACSGSAGPCILEKNDYFVLQAG